MSGPYILLLKLDNQLRDLWANMVLLLYYFIKIHCVRSLSMNFGYHGTELQFICITNNIKSG